MIGARSGADSQRAYRRYVFSNIASFGDEVDCIARHLAPSAFDASQCRAPRQWSRSVQRPAAAPNFSESRFLHPYSGLQSWRAMRAIDRQFMLAGG
jgi:hypothetical protein